MSELDYSFSYEDNDKTLTVTCNIADAPQKQKIFVTPNYDFGDVSNARINTPETDYLNIIKENVLTLTFNENNLSRVETVSIDNGSNYSNGIYLKLNESGEPVAINQNEEISILVGYNNQDVEEARRISFEVI